MTSSPGQGNTSDNGVVAILNNLQDFAILQQDLWYRIPVVSANKWLRTHWPPRWMAFYHTKVFGSLAYGIHYYTRVVKIRVADRHQLFPNEPSGPRTGRKYYQVFVEPLRRLRRPVPSKRLRRVVFIPTTWGKLRSAGEINDLFDGSPLEDRLWDEFKRRRITAERQEFVRVGGNEFALDFAIYCASGKLDIETDGDLYHANRDRAAIDNHRNNALETAGWDVLRFSTNQIQEDLQTYTMPTILTMINKRDGIDEGRILPRRFGPDNEAGLLQAGLFDGPDE